MSVEDVASLIESTLLNFRDEAELQRNLSEFLTSVRIPHRREVQLDARNRVDFLLDDGIIIETKVDGATTDLLRQLLRYAAFSDVTGIVVVSTVGFHRGIPAAIHGIPTKVVYLSNLTNRPTTADAIGAVRYADDGTVTYGDVYLHGSQATMVAAPHVVVKMRRLFPRSVVLQSGQFRVGLTGETATDLLWVFERWPMRYHDDVRAELERLAAQRQLRIDTAAQVMAGHPVDATEMRETARPPRWPHQATNANLITVSKRLLITDNLGAGKTYSALTTLRNPDSLPAVVVVPTHIQDQWRHEIAASWPDLTSHIVTKGTPYDPTTKRGVDWHPDVLIVPYSKLAGWEEVLTGVRTIVFDEIHELRNGATTAKGGAASRLAHDATYVIGLTATPVFNYGGDIHNIMDVVSPGILGTRAEFLREHCGQDNDNGKPKVADPEALAAFLRAEGVMVGTIVEGPEPLLIEHAVESNTKVFDQAVGDAAALARFILSDQTSTTDRWRASGEFDMRMRQATGIAKAPYVAAFVDLLLESVDKVLLFGWHRAVYEVWMERLAKHHPVLYTGSETPQRKLAAKHEFVNGDAKVLIMSLRSGQGLDGLQKVCHTTVFGELDWSPAQHDQAVGRLNRPGQNHQVLAYFLTSDTGADPTMIDVLGVKDRQAAPFSGKQAAPFASADIGNRVKEMAERFLAEG